MFINTQAFFDENRMTQSKLAEITGISRYTISKAVKNHDNPNFYIEDDAYYKISRQYPGLFPLPDDFKYYSNLSLVINRYLNNVDQNTFRTECTHAMYLSNHPGYLYSIKDKMDAIFPEFYIPYYKENGKWVFYEKPYLLTPNDVAPPNIRLEYVKREKSEVGREEFKNYSLQNVIINALCHKIQRKDLAEQLKIGKDELYRLIQTNKEESVSFYMDKEYLESYFNPYIIPKKIKIEK